LDSPAIGSADDRITALYSLISSIAGELIPIDGQRQLLLSLGESEVQVTVGADQSIEFSNLSALSQLASEDVLALRLYSNNDSANILWEYAFGTVAIATDLNRDGQVKFSQKKNQANAALSDRTSELKPFRFWLNNDFDVVNDSGDIDLNVVECPSTTGNQVCEQWDEPTSEGTNTDTDKLIYIESKRDLEDFAPMALTLNASRGKDGTIQIESGITVELRAVGMGINLFKGEWTEGTDYLTNATTLNKQVEDQARDKHLFELKDSSVDGAFLRRLSKDDLDNMFGRKSVAKLIFEGVTPSSPDCAEDATNCYIEFRVKSGSKVISSDKLFMAMLPVKHYYDHKTFGTGHGRLEAISASPTSENTEYDYKPILIQSDPDVEQQKDEYIALVHGWRMRYDERVQFGETAFKRLYWSGYKGRFGLYSWPTGWFRKPAHVYDTLQLLWLLSGNEQNYGDSEMVARATGAAFANELEKLNQDKNVHVVAHSMGNVVVSEALRNARGQKLVDHYVASQAATVGSAYDPLEGFMEHRLAVSGGLGCSNSDNNIPLETAWRCYNSDETTFFTETEYDLPPNLYSYSYNPAHGPTSPDFETIGDPNKKPYYGNIGQASGQIINFHNKDDIALAGWEFNQLTKPDDDEFFPDASPTYTYNYKCYDTRINCIIKVNPDAEDGDLVTDEYKREFAISFDQELVWSRSIPTDMPSAEILGHMIPARTNALGQRPMTSEQSVISGEFDLTVF
jgi:hypothetical protein